MEEEECQNKVQIPLVVGYSCSLFQHLGHSPEETVKILNEFDEKSISVKSVKRYYQQLKEEGNIVPKYHHNGNPKYSIQTKEKLFNFSEKIHNQCFLKPLDPRDKSKSKSEY